MFSYTFVINCFSDSRSFFFSECKEFYKGTLICVRKSQIRHFFLLYHDIAHCVYQNTVCVQMLH